MYGGLTFLSLFIYSCPSGPRIPVCPPRHSMPNGVLDTYLPFHSFFFLLFFFLNLPIWAVDTCFYSFFLLLSPSGPWIPAFCKKKKKTKKPFSVHRDLGYLRLVFFSHAQRGLGYLLLLFFFLFLLPIGAVDTCFKFFFSRPNGALGGWKYGFVSYCTTWNIYASYLRVLLLLIVWCCVSEPMA